jgi:sugar phosphate permease
MADNKDTHTSTVSYLHDSDQDEKSSRFDANPHTTYDKDQYVAGYDAKLVTKSGNVIDAEGNVIVTSADSGSDIEGGLRDNIFLDPEVANYYRDIYENARYEGRHVFDPELTWTKEEERKIVWKLEFRVCLVACIMFMALQLDRGNISQALSDNMLKDLGMTTNNYNLGQTLFYISFLSAELPSQLISKKLGPDRWIPTQITLWSIVAISQSRLSGFGSFIATRVLLGVLEGGFIPDVILWLSYFYTSKELPIRLSFFWTALSVTQIIASLLAFALLRMRGVNGWEGWRWLFLIEGIATLIIGLSAFFLMPPSPVQTKTWYRPKGWFTDREEKIVVNRVLRDDPSKGDMHNRQALTPKMLWQSISDYDLWPLYIVGLIAYIPTGTAGAYMTLNLRALGFSPFNTNLLTIPNNVAHIILLLIITWMTEFFNERSLISCLQPLWIIPCLGVLRWWPGVLTNVWGTYAVMTILLSAPYIHAILVSWCSRNSNTVRSRTTSAALYNMFVQAGSIIASNIYRKDDLPKYKRGNMQLFAIAWASLGALLLTKAYYIWRNKSRDKIWNAMTLEEQHHYRATTKDKGNKRLDFRFAH